MSPFNARLVGANRLYTFRGREYPSVTSILQAYPKPALRDWYGRMAAAEAIKYLTDPALETTKDVIAALADADFAAHAATKTHQERHKKSCDFAPSAFRWLSTAATRTRDEAGARGTAVHESAEHDRDIEDVPENAKKRYEAYRAWVERYKPTVLAKEFQVVNEDDGYAGSGDLIAEVNGVVYLIDLKTSNSVHHDMRLQLAAYRYASDCIHGDDYDDEATEALRLVETCALLHLTDEGFSFLDANVGPRQYRQFLDVKDVFDGLREVEGSPVGVLIPAPVQEQAA